MLNPLQAMEFEKWHDFFCYISFNYTKNSRKSGTKTNVVYNVHVFLYLRSYENPGFLSTRFAHFYKCGIRNVFFTRFHLVCPLGSP